LATFLKGRYLTLQLLFGAPLKATNLHSTLAVFSLFERKEFYIKLLLGLLWKQGTYTLQLLFGAL